MDFDQMFETWRAQNAAPPYDVNRDALRQALHDEQARVQRSMRIHRRGLWFAGIVGAGMAVWAAFWIAITLTNGWPVIYAMASAVSLIVFTLGAGALWLSSGRDPERKFGNTLDEEVRRSLALIDYQLSITVRWLLPLLGTACIVVGTGLFSWTVNESQDIPNSPGRGWFWFTVVLVGFIVWRSYKARDERRRVTETLELRRRRLRELLAGLEGRE